MKKELFDELVESIQQMGAIHRGEMKPSREFHYPSERTPRRRTRKQFAICINTDDPELLEPRKIYQVTVLADDLLKVIDEAGEAAVYPTDYFVVIDLPRVAERALFHARR
ncbi:MAG: hypothetical protein ACR2LC_02555 [Pyrinomonadaceae bacterium]